MNLLNLLLSKALRLGLIKDHLLRIRIHPVTASNTVIITFSNTQKRIQPPTPCSCPIKPTSRDHSTVPTSIMHLCLLRHLTIFLSTSRLDAIHSFHHLFNSKRLFSSTSSVMLHCISTPSPHFLPEANILNLPKVNFH